MKQTGTAGTIRLGLVDKFMDANIECFGGCPYCGGYDIYLDIGRDHWMVCRTHQVRWHIGSNLFSAWREQTEEQRLRNTYELAGYREVESVFPSELPDPVSGSSAKIIPFPNKGRAVPIDPGDPEAA